MGPDGAPCGVAALHRQAVVTSVGWSPWRTVVWFGLVSLAADMVYEGARSIYGPFLAALGASAAVVGIVTGAGEGLALVVRLVAGPLADRTGAYWSLTFWGYAATAVCVPLLALAPTLGSAGLVVATALIWAERTAKAIRSPAKSALLAEAAGQVGRGKGIAVHKALDQIGAFAGPLVVAGTVAVLGSLAWGLAVLAIPGVAALVLLAVTRARSGLDLPAPKASAVSTGAATGAGSATGPATGSVGERAGGASSGGASSGGASGGGASGGAPKLSLPPEFSLFAASCAGITVGLMTFGVIGYHLVTAGLVTAAVVPLVYAGAMAVEAVAALATGVVYDRIGAAVLLVLPVLVTLIPWLALGPGLAAVLIGVAIWGAATGISDSTVKALVADLVPRERLATAYGVFAAVQGVAALAGGGLSGWLYQDHRTLLIGIVAACQGFALLALLRVLRRTRS